MLRNANTRCKRFRFELVVGDREVGSGQVNVRVRGHEKTEGSFAVEAFMERVKTLIETKAAGL